MPLPFHPMYLEALKASQMPPYTGPGLPAGEGAAPAGPAPLQEGNQYGSTPFGVMGQYPPPGNQQDPLLGQPEQIATQPPQMGGVPPNPVGDPNLLAMEEQYGEPPPIPDYATFDSETEAMARLIQKEGFYDMLIAAGAGGMQHLGGTIAQTMGGMARGVAGLPSPRLAAQDMRMERQAQRREIGSTFLSDRKNYFQGVQEGQKAEWIAQAEGGGGLNPWSGPGGSPFGARGRGGPTASQQHKTSAFAGLMDFIPEDKLEEATAMWMQDQATGGGTAFADFTKANGFWGQDIADPEAGLIKIGQGGVIFDSIGNSYLIPSLSGNKWIRSEDISIPDPSALGQDQAMQDQVRLEISIANSIKRMVSKTATPDEIAKVTAGLSPEKAMALQSMVELQMGGGESQIPPEELHALVYEWLDRSGYTSQLMRTGGLVLRPGAMAHPNQQVIRQGRISPTGQAPGISTPARGVLPMTGQDQGYQRQGGSTFKPGSIEAMDMAVAAEGGAQSYYDKMVAQGEPPDAKPGWRKRLDMVFGERYGVGPLALKDTPSPTAHGPAEPVGTLLDTAPANLPASDTLGPAERLAADSDRIAAEQFSLPKRERPRVDYEISETGGFKVRDEGGGDIGKSIGTFVREAIKTPVAGPEQLKEQRTSLLADVTRGLSFTDKRKLREHLAGMSDEEAIAELKRLKQEMY